MSQELGKLRRSPRAVTQPWWKSQWTAEVWAVPNMMFARLGYAVGSAVGMNIDELGNLRGVSPPENQSDE